MRKHNQSWLAGFFRGGSCTHVLCFSKKLKKKLGIVVVLLPLSVKIAEDVVTTSPIRKKAFWGRGRALME
jgi:hypothetical protein